MMPKILIAIYCCAIQIVSSQITDFKAIDFTKANNTAKKLSEVPVSDLKQLSSLLTKNLETDVEKFNAIFIWVTHHIKGSQKLMDSYEWNIKKYKNNPKKLKQWKKGFRREVFKHLQKYNETLCTGYAYLIKSLANAANINCQIVNGTSGYHSKKVQKPNHCWNAVFLNNKWYLCDATWAAGYTLASDQKFIFDYNNFYFLTPPKKLIKTHKPLLKKWELIGL